MLYITTFLFVFVLIKLAERLLSTTVIHKKPLTVAAPHTLRSLTQEELAALTHFGYTLAEPIHVFSLTGSIIKSPLVLKNGGADSYFTLGDILLKAPLQIKQHIKEHNQAHLITDGHTCILLNLNDRYSLVERYHQESASHVSIAWLAGTEVDAIIANDVQRERTREATKAEYLAANAHYHSPFRSSAILLLYFTVVIFFGISVLLHFVHDAVSPYLQVAQAVIIMNFFWRLRRKPTVPTRLPNVCRISGELTEVTDTHLKLGDLTLTYPAHWQAYFKKGHRVQLEVFVEQAQVIAVVGNFSLVDEKSRFKGTQRQRYGFAFSFAVLCVWIISYGLHKPFMHWQHVKLQITNNAYYHFGAAAELIPHNWQLGERVTIQAPARCMWDVTDGQCQYLSFTADLHPNLAIQNTLTDTPNLYRTREEHIDFHYFPAKHQTQIGNKASPTLLKIEDFSSMLARLTADCAFFNDIDCDALFSSLRVSYNDGLLYHPDNPFSPSLIMKHF